MIILSSPSGAGKTTLVKLISKNNNLYTSVSHTTRSPRTNEVDGIDYFFVNKKKFQNLINEDQFLEAETFLRTSEIRDNIYHHIGIYCYTKETLEKFVKFRQSQNEIKNRLEQLRALDNNIKINVALAKSSPIGVDTEEDYIALKKIMEYKS